MYAALKYLSFMSACMILWVHVLFTYQNMCIALKIQLLHLKLDFFTLKSSEGFAALCWHVHVSVTCVGCIPVCSYHSPGQSRDQLSAGWVHTAAFAPVIWTKLESEL